jgi:hypothetical protein
MKGKLDALKRLGTQGIQCLNEYGLLGMLTVTKKKRHCK